MRLIDADKILKRIESWNTSDAIDKALYNFTLNRIIEQPTVEAVPISFIEEMKAWAERTRSFTAEEWEFYKKVNREKMHKTGLNIYDLLNKKEE